jgi:ligand-binding sensor domain-containing protein
VAAAAPINDSYNITGAFPQSAEPYRIILFVPSPNMIHSDQVLDQINTPEGGVLFGTSFGLSLYNGTWSTRHINHDNISQGLMDDYITAVEYDPDGNLWIGYSGGIQIYNGIYYQTLRDQQLFKDPRIQDLQRWHDDMWVATGQSGIHRFRNGVWTWFQPMSKRGPGFYEIWSMTLDPASDTLVIATTDNGIWIVRSPDDPVIFEQIAQKDGSYHDLKNVRRDPLGGVYFFNDTTVIHYSNTAGFTSVLTVSDLSFTGISINDLTASPEGKLFVATDDGIYIWSNNQVYRHLGRFEGIGTSEAVRTVTIDRQNRVWFSSAGYVGYYLEQPGSQTTISIELVTPTTEPPLTPLEDQSNISVTHEVSPQQNAEPVVVSQQEGLSPILDPIFKAINSVLVKIGLKQDSP